MNSISSFNMRSWAVLLLFELVSFGFCLGIAAIFTAFGILNQGFVEGGGTWKFGSFIFSIWLVLSLLSVVEYKFGLTRDNAIPIMALIAILPASGMFVVLWPMRHSGWSLIGGAAFLTVIVSAAGLGVALAFVICAERLGKALAPFFRFIGI